MRSLPRWAASLFLFIILGAGAYYLRTNNPSENPTGFVPCLLQKTTGLDCPGCGATRATHHLLNGELDSAVKMNVAYVIILPFLLFGGAVMWLRWMAPNHEFWFDPLLKKLPRSVPLAFLGLMILFGLLRNLPFPPFTWLAPG